MYRNISLLPLLPHLSDEITTHLINQNLCTKHWSIVHSKKTKLLKVWLLQRQSPVVLTLIITQLNGQLIVTTKNRMYGHHL